MMKIDTFHKYGLTLSRLQMNEIEMLRQWRNDPKISKFMTNDAFITYEQQIEWFETIKNKTDAFYFIVYLNKKPIGYSAIKNIDWKTKQGETGDFMYIPKYIKNPILPCLKAYLTYDFYFEHIGLNGTYSYVKKDNLKSQQYCNGIGYKYIEEKENFYYYTLSKDNYISNKTKFLKIIMKNENWSNIINEFDIIH